VSRIHPSAVVDPAAKVAADVEIGPLAVVEAGAVIGEGSWIGAQATIHGGARLGRRNKVYPHAVVGGEPQDLKFKGEQSSIEIGDENLIREFVTLNRGTAEGGGVTRIGSHNLFMAYSHIAHDCVVGDHVVLSNGVAIAGHGHLESHCVIGGMAGLHQFARIGEYAMAGGLSRLSKDVLPYTTTSGCDEVKVYGMNKIGLKRSGISKPDFEALDHALHVYLNSQLGATDALKELDALPQKNSQIEHLIHFIRTSSRGVYR
jgi:UDP-N-acetylglucosamine acyltransferase